MKILTIIDNKVEKNDRWLWHYLPEEEKAKHSFDFIWVDSSRIKSRLHYFSYFLLGIRAFRKSSNYDVIISWEAKCGIIFAFLQRLFSKKKPRHILLGFILKKGLKKLNCLTKWALLSVAKIVVYSEGEIESYSRDLSIPKDKFIFIPLADFYTLKQKEILIEEAEENYVFAVGSSNRDYKTLATCARDIKSDFLIVVRSADIAGIDFPKNVEVKFNIYGENLNRLLVKAKIVVIPLKDPSYSAGQLILLKAMAMGKPVVVTENIGIIDYVRNKETAIIVKPQRASELKDALNYLLENFDKAKELGEKALEDFKKNFTVEAFAQNVMDLIKLENNR